MLPDDANASPAAGDDAGGNAGEPELPPYRIEAARSSRSRCRTCRRKIDKGKLRLGVLLEGPYGTGYLWHHLTCAAKRRIEDVEAAYAESCWDKALEVPPLDDLRALQEKAAKEKAERKQAPYVELAPSGRSKCKNCNELIEKGAPRVALLREVVFGRQSRATPILVHPRCVPAELLAADCMTEPEHFEEQVRANSRDIEEVDLVRALDEVGELA